MALLALTASIFAILGLTVTKVIVVDIAVEGESHGVGWVLTKLIPARILRLRIVQTFGQKHKHLFFIVNVSGAFYPAKRGSFVVGIFAGIFHISAGIFDAKIPEIPGFVSPQIG